MTHRYLHTICRTLVAVSIVALVQHATLAAPKTKEPATAPAATKQTKKPAAVNANTAGKNKTNKKTLPTKAAATATQAQNLPSYQNREEVRVFAKEIAERNGLDETRVLKSLEQAKYQPAVAKAIVPPSRTSVRNWEKYRDRYVEPVRIKGGLQFWEANEAILQKTSERSGVPEEIIVAIIGVETIFGKHTGSFRTVDALSTLAFDFPPAPRNRSDFFRSELEALFLLSRETGMDPLEIKGSFAGAVGLGQFMPSSWRRFAVDGNLDGTIDLFHSVDDAVASVGNFLKIHGWKKGDFWFVRAAVSDSESTRQNVAEIVDEGILPRFTNEQLKQRGIVSLPSEFNESIKPEELLCLVDLPIGTETVDYRVGGKNFYAVTRYNRSNFYAMSVMELAIALRNARKATMPNNGVNSTLAKSKG
ncbi:MAG: lytic murein transglycosylase B [Burkholderiales bacterium]|nr:lytic murein transglycosylase B [Burkholderiales bacterium]